MSEREGGREGGKERERERERTQRGEMKEGMEKEDQKVWCVESLRREQQRVKE